MSVSLEQKYQKVISQQTAVTFQSLGLGMLFTRLIGKYKANPTAGTMSSCVAEVEAFVSKYESVLGADLSKLQSI